MQTELSPRRRGWMRGSDETFLCIDAPIVELAEAGGRGRIKLPGNLDRRKLHTYCM